MSSIHPIKDKFNALLKAMNLSSANAFNLTWLQLCRLIKGRLLHTHIKFLLTFNTHSFPSFIDLEKESVKNIVGKGENAGNFFP